MAVLEFNLADEGNFEEAVKLIAVKGNTKVNILAGEERGLHNRIDGIIILFNALYFNIGNLNAGNINLKAVFAVIIKNIPLETSCTCCIKILRSI